jgi:AcrR family transcriptional regulator
MTQASLREQQAETARKRILAAVAEMLERDSVEELTVPQVAEAAGVSLRTVYRYYKSRDALLEAAGRFIGAELLGQGYPESLDDVADSFEPACSDFDRHPGLVRALALSRLGRETRGYRRRGRVRAIRAVLVDEVGELPEPELRQAGAVLAYLHNMLAYTTLREESDLSGEEIGQALGWAIRTLVADLRKRQRRARRET